MKHWSATTWVLMIVGGILLLVGIDVGRQVLVNTSGGVTAPDAEVPAEGKTPEFKVGDKAPDFTFKDAAGTPHSLSSMVKGDTTLSFICGCSQCEEMQLWLSKLYKKMGAKAPKVVSVSTAAKEGEEAWKRKTELKQTIVFEEDGPEKERVEKIYKGHPCPRLFRLEPDLTVAWIGPSPTPDAPLDLMKEAVASMHGYQPYYGKDPNKPKAPPYVDMTPPKMATKPLVAKPQDATLPPYLKDSPYENK
jgi:hypothetical protein